MPTAHLNRLALANAIRELDPSGQYVVLDVEASQVTYAHEILQSEVIRDFVGDEEPVRAYFVAWLCTRGNYAPSAITLERRYSFGRDGRAELDIRLSQDGEPTKAYALIEMKAPSEWGGVDDARIEGQLFAPAGQEPDATVLSLATVEVGPDGTPSIKTVTIAYEPTLTYELWRRAGSEHVDEFPVNYNAPVQEPYAPGTQRDLRVDVDRAELERLRRQMHDTLWGGSRDDNQIYAWLIRLFITKIHDEKLTDEGEPYKFQVLHEGSRKEAPHASLTRVSTRYVEAHSGTCLATPSSTWSRWTNRCFQHVRPNGLWRFSRVFR